MPSSSSTVEPINNFTAGGSRRARELAQSVPAMRAAAVPATARARISAAKPKKRARVLPLGPTPERLAKGDAVRSNAGFHRSVPVIERLRDQGKLDHDVRANEAMYQAAEKLRRHYEACAIGIKAQNLDKVFATGASDLTQEEGWVHNFDTFRRACKLMGWHENSPTRGAGRLVVAVACQGSTVTDAAATHVGRGEKAAIMGAAMDRLREGLYVLATHWRMV